MTTYGLTLEGFVPKTLEVIRDEINARLRDRFGASLDLSDQDPLGHLVGLIALELAETWEVTEAVNAAQSRENAQGAALVGIGLLTGTIRPAASRSEVTLYLTGTATTVVAAQSRAETTSTGIEFRTIAEVTIAAATAWVNTTAYVVGDVRTNASRIYRCITAGTSAGSGGPTTTAADITDGTAHWRYLGEGAGYVTAEAEAVDTGALVALNGDITTIVTPVSGWSSVMNIADASLGADEASDEEYRMLQERDLTAPASGTVDAITQALLEVADVEAVHLFVNNTDTTDGEGVPPHAVEALVLGGDDQEIANTIFGNVAAGIATHGTEDLTVTDSEGNEHDISFSRPQEIDIFVELDVYFPTGETPTGAEALVKAAIVAMGNSLSIGYNATSRQVIRAAMGVEGVIDVLNVLCDGVDPPVATSQTISSRQKSAWDSGNIVVNLLEGTP